MCIQMRCENLWSWKRVIMAAILLPLLLIRLRGRVVRGVGHLDHVWSYGVRVVVSSIPDRGNIVGWVFHPTSWLAWFSLIWKCLSFQILNLFRTLSSWGSDNYRPSAPLLYEVASHVKQLPFRPLWLLLNLNGNTCKQQLINGITIFNLLYFYIMYVIFLFRF